MSREQLIGELVRTHTASHQFKILADELISQVNKQNIGPQTFRYGEFNITVTPGQVFGTNLSILKAQDVTPKLADAIVNAKAATGADYPKTRVTPNVDPKQTDTFVPQKGDYFRIEFKSGDRSYRDSIFRCSAASNGAVRAMAVHGCWAGVKEFTFIIKEVNFFDAHDLAKAAQRQTLRQMFDDL